jgi:hypothetical protein
MGWLMGFEPTTTGITIQDSTAELQPPLSCCLRATRWRALQDSNLLARLGRQSRELSFNQSVAGRPQYQLAQ